MTDHAAQQSPVRCSGRSRRRRSPRRRVGLLYNAARARLSLGALLARHADRTATTTIDQARRELLEMGCRIDIVHDDGTEQTDMSTCALLIGLGRRERADVLSSFTVRRFDAGDVLTGPDVEREPAAFVIRSGQVRLVAKAADGRRMTIDLLEAGDVVGESLALGHDIDSLHAEAIGEVVVGVLTAPLLQRLVDRHPMLGRNARRETVNGLMKHLREAGVIELRKRRIVVLDPERLRELAL